MQKYRNYIMSGRNFMIFYTSSRILRKIHIGRESVKKRKRVISLRKFKNWKKFEDITIKGKTHFTGNVTLYSKNIRLSMFSKKIEPGMHT